MAAYCARDLNPASRHATSRGYDVVGKERQIFGHLSPTIWRALDQ
jgi:hypothetical protein